MSAVLLLASPIFLYQLVQPMSDLPAMTWGLAAATTAWAAGTRWGWFGTGLLASAAILTRPNLAPLALLFVTAPWLRFGDLRRAAPAAGLVVLGLAPATGLMTGVNAYLYGSPVGSGYGSLAMLYDVGNILPNFWAYGTRLIGSQSPLILLALLAPAVHLGDGTLEPHAARGLAVFGVLFALMLVGCYLPYQQFDRWSYLRFLLPALPLGIVLAVVVLRRLLPQMVPAMATTVLVAGTAGLVILGIAGAQTQATFVLGPGSESRYLDAARWASASMPGETIVLAAVHSGSLSYYTDLPVARYDEIGGRLDDFVRAATRAGRAVTLIVDAAERDAIQARFASESRLAQLDWTPIRITERVLAFDLSARIDAIDARR